MLFHSYSISKKRTFLLFVSLLFSLLLLLPTSHQKRAVTQGNNSAFAREKMSKDEENKEMVMANSMIGSRPPQCEKRCLDCVHCEAVQVPATPQERRSAAVRQSTISTNARDDGSNYKPMDWKCKCGNFIFNP